MENRIIVQAKKNFRDYKIIEKYQAALELKGGDEIKSIRNRQVSINEAYILSKKNELYIIDMHIAVYRYSHIRGLSKNRETKRERKLLLKRNEINKLIGVMKAKNYVLVPLQLFITNRGWAKLEIALTQPLRKYQIKEKIKEKEIKKKLRYEEDF